MKNSFTVCQASAGSGKTYTLAATYVALLLSGESFRSILAVTFTNKATDEMKERILLFLDNIARNTGPAADDALSAVRRYMVRNADAPAEELRRRAGLCYRQMLEDYDNIHISTIDTFLMQLLNGLGQMLDDVSASATVELDLKRLVATAVEQLLTNPSEGEAGVVARLEAYVTELMEDERDWNICDQLTHIAEQLYSEAAQALDAEGQIVFDPDKIRAYKQRMDWRKAACVVALHREYEAKKDFVPDGNEYVKWFERLKKTFDGKVDDDDAFRGPTKTQLPKIDPAWMPLVELSAECRRVYLTCKYSTVLMNDLSLMSDIRGSINRLLAEQNTVLLAKTANILHQAMKSGDADFILEKSGIRYRHVMLDEFQDTSVLQWENFRPLLEDILASGGTVFIVGDTKQSIYRWRNGDWRIMANLGSTMTLNQNYRSAREVVEFVMKLFHETYEVGKEGGYVRVRHVPYGKNEAFATRTEARQSIAQEVFRTIEKHLAAGDKGADNMILTRGHKEAAIVVDVYRRMCAAGEIPLTAQAGLVSCDSFHLDSSSTVRRVIEVVRNEPKAEMPLCERMMEAIRTVMTEPDYADITDQAYLSGLMDLVATYTAQYGSDVRAFLRAWDEKLHETAVAAPDSEAVRMLTIHSAKGLEAKNVYIPFCSWPMEKDGGDVMWFEARGMSAGSRDTEMKSIPVPLYSNLCDSDYAAEYNDEHEMQLIDNRNLLYVALTRAAQRLYVYVDTSATALKENKTAGTQILTALGEYESGNEAETVGKASGKKMDDRFSFREATGIAAELHIGERTPEFRQTTESVDYLHYGEMSADNKHWRQYIGTVCHTIFEQTAVRGDELRAIDEARMSGLIADEQMAAEVATLVSGAWEHEQLCDWFSGKWQLLREVTFIDDNKELRPDRVMVDPAQHRAIVLDYKFGEREPKHAKQVGYYMQTLRRMGYTQVEGWLWYARENKLVEV